MRGGGSGSAFGDKGRSRFTSESSPTPGNNKPLSPCVDTRVDIPSVGAKVSSREDDVRLTLGGLLLWHLLAVGDISGGGGGGASSLPSVERSVGSAPSVSMGAGTEAGAVTDLGDRMVFGSSVVHPGGGVAERVDGSGALASGLL